MAKTWFKVSRFTFIKHPDSDGDRTELVYKCEEVLLPDILEEFAQFLAGCGFHVPNGVEISDIETTDYNESRSYE